MVIPLDVICKAYAPETSLTLALSACFFPKSMVNFTPFFCKDKKFKSEVKRPCLSFRANPEVISRGISLEASERACGVGLMINPLWSIFFPGTFHTFCTSERWLFKSKSVSCEKSETGLHRQAASKANVFVLVIILG